MTTRQETVEKLNRFGKDFRALQRVLMASGDFKSMQQATICAGLAEVCDMLASDIQTRRREIEQAT